MSDKYYVMSKKGKWFAFADGHFHMTSNYSSASVAIDLVEANRMLNYAKGISTIPKIVTTRIEAYPVNQLVVDEALMKSAREKLTDDELRLLRQ